MEQIQGGVKFGFERKQQALQGFSGNGKIQRMTDSLKLELKRCLFRIMGLVTSADYIHPYRL